jgi:hypothetical protein
VEQRVSLITLAHTVRSPAEVGAVIAISAR